MGYFNFPFRLEVLITVGKFKKIPVTSQEKNNLFFKSEILGRNNETFQKLDSPLRYKQKMSHFQFFFVIPKI